MGKTNTCNLREDERLAKVHVPVRQNRQGIQRTC